MHDGIGRSDYCMQGAGHSVHLEGRFKVLAGQRLAAGHGLQCSGLAVRAIDPLECHHWCHPLCLHPETTSSLSHMHGLALASPYGAPDQALTLWYQPRVMDAGFQSLEPCIRQKEHRPGSCKAAQPTAPSKHKLVWYTCAGSILKMW